MWCFLLFTVILPIVPTLTEVVSLVSDCNEFLLEEKPPEVPDILKDGNILNPNRYKPVCQTYKNMRRFFTLYDIKNRIPVFSAYKFKGEEDTGRPHKRWMMEPQLEDRNINNMMDEKYLNQAYNYDYTNIKDYNRGHLFPCCHANDNSDKESTFTLTNAVPQAITFNNGSWKNMETCIKCVLEKYCINNNNVTEGFVVTGAVPSMNKKLKNRVNIPSTLWSAFCCYSQEKNKWLASAHWGNNRAEPNKGIFMKTNTLNQLHQELRINVFKGTSCPLDETVVDYYKDLPGNCQCPPTPLTTPASLTMTVTVSPTISATSTTQTTTEIIPTITEPQTYTTIHHDIQFLSRLSKSVSRGCIDLCSNRHGRLDARYKSFAVPRNQELLFLDLQNPELTLDGFQVSTNINEPQPDTENKKFSNSPILFHKNAASRRCWHICRNILRTQKRRPIIHLTAP